MSQGQTAHNETRDILQAGNAEKPSFERSNSHPFRAGWNSRTKTYNSDKQLVEEASDESPNGSSLSSGSPEASSKVILEFEKDDPGNPYNWSTTKKIVVVLMGVLTVLNSTIGSSLPSGVIPQLTQQFGVTNTEQLVLPNSMFLVGYVLGPIVFAPLSESFGRQIVMMGTFVGFTIFTVAIPFSPNWAAFVIFRLLCGTFASSPISVVGGVYADLYDNTINRGRAMAAFMTATSTGPMTGPIISGYLGPISWQWPFWFALAFAGVTWIPFAFYPETFGPVILQRRAKKIRKANPGSNVYARLDLEKRDIGEIITKVVTRPLRMFCFEPVVLSSCIYLAFIYGILYMFFLSFSEIYPPIYGFSLGETGLAFLPIGVGSVFAGCVYLTWDKILQNAWKRGDKWAESEEYKRLPLAVLGGPLLAIALYWIGWTARADIHWIVPIIGALPFGIGFLLLFMALINYLVDAYESYAASALAASSFSRSLFGAVLPFGAPPMFENLGVAWACTLLGIIATVMCLVPFAFIRFGPWIRAHSKFCQQLAEERERKQRENEQQQTSKDEED